MISKSNLIKSTKLDSSLKRSFFNKIYYFISSKICHYKKCIFYLRRAYFLNLSAVFDFILFFVICWNMCHYHFMYFLILKNVGHFSSADAPF